MSRLNLTLKNQPMNNLGGSTTPLKIQPIRGLQQLELVNNKGQFFEFLETNA